jgi:phosphoinositide-3-kinase regulatory subunit 4
MIKRMIALDPAGRPTFDVLLHTARGTVFPESFYSFLHNYAASVNELPSTSLFAAPPSVPATLTPNTKNPAASALPQDTATSAAFPSDSDNRIDRVWSEFDGVEAYLIPETSDEQPAVKVGWSPPNSDSVTAFTLQGFTALTLCRTCSQ